MLYSVTSLDSSFRRVTKELMPPETKYLADGHSFMIFESELEWEAISEILREVGLVTKPDPSWFKKWVGNEHNPECSPTTEKRPALLQRRQEPKNVSKKLPQKSKKSSSSSDRAKGV